MEFDKCSTLASVLSSQQAEFVDLLYDLHFSIELVERFGVKVPSPEDLPELKHIFLLPMLKLLKDALIKGSDTLLAIYMDERLRYAPHQADEATRSEYHKYIVNKEIKAITKSFGDSTLADAWLNIHACLFEKRQAKQVSILALGDCLLNELRVFASREGLKHNLSVDVRCMYFNASRNGALSLDEVIEYLAKHSIDIIALSFFTFDAMPGFRRFFEHCDRLSASEIDNQCTAYVSSVSDYLQQLAVAYEGTFVLHGVSGLPLGRWPKYLPFVPAFSSNQKLILKLLNTYLRETAKQHEACLFYDEMNVVQQHGYRKMSSQVASQRTYKGMFHTSLFGVVLAQYYAEVAHAFSLFDKSKLLLLDFDNTLWNGVIGDGEVKHYRDRQRLLINLQNRGLVLAAVSKNSPENIRWNEMTLKSEHFAIEKISWEPKTNSISQISQELNLGLNSFVFIDDNRHERQLVENELPDVLCLDADDESVWRYLEMAKSFSCARSTDEAKRRTEMYRQQAARSKVSASSGNNEQALKKLGLWYTFDKVDKSQMERVHELVSRTNQFNTTTKRYSKAQLVDFVSNDNSDIFVANLGDSYGGLGLVAVVIVFIEDDLVEIDSFIMSCRAMGFGLENQVLFELSENFKHAKTMKGLFYPTDRNSPCASIYANNGFVLESDNDWVLPLGSALLKSVQWLTKK